VKTYEALVSWKTKNKKQKTKEKTMAAQGASQESHPQLGFEKKTTKKG